ncbi:hypothetical protein GGF32_008197 [Allomyces javanicus]|nr:hypothetical protein GGF32_008197 [Allomyces javanicus]
MKPAPTASTDANDTSNNDSYPDAAENRRLRDEHQAAWIKLRAQSLTTDFLGLITTKLEDLAAINRIFSDADNSLTLTIIDDAKETASDASLTESDDDEDPKAWIEKLCLHDEY